MNGRYIYSLYDLKTGALLHRGTPKELVEMGLYTREDSVSNGYNKQKRSTSGKLRRWRMEREAVPRKPGEEQAASQKTVWKYKLYGEDGQLLQEGTGAELAAQGVIPCVQTAANWYKAGQAKAHGFYHITREPVEVWVAHNAPAVRKALPTAPKPEPKRPMPKLRGIENPTKLQLDVHDLCCYNAAARKAGRKELSYGYWKAAGAPARP